MEIHNFTPLPSLLGGLLIGLGAGIVFLAEGKIAGISGIVARLFRPVPGDSRWRVLFLVGMPLGAGAVFWIAPGTAAHVPQAGLWGALGAGLLVGLGTRLGGGCTSGHGVCGIPRGSLRSAVATLVFLGTGCATVYLVRHVLGVSP